MNAMYRNFHDLPDPDLDPQFYAGIPLKRLIAWVLDLVAIVLLSAVVTLVMGVLTLGLAFVLFVPISFVVGFAYRTMSIAARSATPGMMFVGVELRGPDGSRFGPVQAAIHSGTFMVLMVSVLGWIATAFAIAGTRRHQGLPDLLLGSVAINRPAE